MTISGYERLYYNDISCIKTELQKLVKIMQRDLEIKQKMYNMKYAGTIVDIGNKEK